MSSTDQEFEPSANPQLPSSSGDEAIASDLFKDEGNSASRPLTSPMVNATVDSEVPSRYIVRAGKQPTYYLMSPGNIRLQHGDEIVCRTHRGIELGEVLTEWSMLGGPEGGFDAGKTVSDGGGGTEVQAWPQAKWLRPSRPEDRFLLDKLEEMSCPARDACQQFLEEQNLDDVLLEVEPLLDGRTLYFHFLGEPGPETEQCIDRLANEYQASVAKSRFAELVEKGCGPGCGTKEKSGCGTSGGCAVCSIAGGCTKR